MQVSPAAKSCRIVMVWSKVENRGAEVASCACQDTVLTAIGMHTAGKAKTSTRNWKKPFTPCVLRDQR